MLTFLSSSGSALSQAPAVQSIDLYKLLSEFQFSVVFSQAAAGKSAESPAANPPQRNKIDARATSSELKNPPKTNLTDERENFFWEIVKRDAMLEMECCKVCRPIVILTRLESLIVTHCWLGRNRHTLKFCQRDSEMGGAPARAMHRTA